MFYHASRIFNEYALTRIFNEHAITNLIIPSRIFNEHPLRRIFIDLFPLASLMNTLAWSIQGPLIAILLIVANICQ